jgi:prophage DNA circulation protein
MSDLWKARLLPASFRGIPFFIESHEHSGGRNTKRHEMPDRDGGLNEDLGKKTDLFRFEAHVVGDNYFFIRDALIEAMKTKSSGVLIHPYLGIKSVQAEGYTLREDTKQGRIAFFSLEFGEAGSSLFPFSQIDSHVAFATSAVSTIAQIQNGFELVYTVAQLPAFVLESAESALTDLANTVENIFSNVRLDSTQHANMKKRVDDFRADISDLARDGAELTTGVNGLIGGLVDLVPDPPDASTIDSTSGRDDKLAVFNDLVVFDAGVGEIPETTPSRIAEKSNITQINNLVQQLALVYKSQQIVDKEFKSNQEAEEARTETIESIEVQLLKAELSDDSFQALEDLVAKLVLAVPDVNSNFANIRTRNQLNSVPSLVLSYNLYESVDNEQDIIDRNSLREPGFAQGLLEVLSS